MQALVTIQYTFMTRLILESTWQVGRLEDLVEIQRRKRELLTRDDDDDVAADDGGGEERDEGQEGRRVGAGDAWAGEGGGVALSLANKNDLPALTATRPRYAPESKMI
jgi:hypothetical protein